MSDHDETGLSPAADGWGLMADLADAVGRGDARGVAALLHAGADPEAVEELDDPTVLMRAAEAGDIEVVRALVEGGADVNAEACDEDLDRLLEADEAEAVGSSVSALLYAALKDRRAVYDYLHPLTKAALRRDAERALKTVRRLRKPAKRDRRPKALLEAARKGSAEEVGALLAAGVDANTLDERRNSALWNAVAFKPSGSDGMLAVVEHLLTAGADPNVRNADGDTPLHTNGDATVARRLLDAGADPNARNGMGNTPLTFAAIGLAPELVRTLIERGADPNATGFQGKTPLILAAERGLADNAAVLVAAGAGLWARDEQGFTAYRLARWRRHQAVTDLLRDAGAVRESTRQLVDAAAAGRLDEVERLTAAGADVRDHAEPEPDFEMTALHAAARAGHDAVVRALVAAGADVHARTQHFADRAGRELTPLLLAATGGHAEVIRALLEAGAKPDATSVFLDNETPLLRAAASGHRDAVRVLLEAGVDPRRAGSADGLDALGRAERNGHREVAALLHEFGA